MFSKIIAVCALVATCQAGLLPEPHYSSAAAVSSQSIIRHDQAHDVATKLVATPIAKVAVTAPVAYHSAPAHYSSAAAVSSQSIVRHDQPHATKLIAAAPVTKLAVAAPVYHAEHAHYAAPAHYAAASVHYAAAPVAHYAAAPVAQYAAAPVAHYATPIAKVIAPVQHNEEAYAHPKYDFAYSVADSHTGDIKSQQESRDGDAVHGSYSLHEADGSVRTVEYTADDHQGFNAVVHNTAPTAASVVYKAAPVLVKAAPALQYYHH